MLSDLHFMSDHLRNTGWVIGIGAGIYMLIQLNQAVIFEFCSRLWQHYVQSLSEVHGRLFRSDAIETFARRVLLFAVLAGVLGVLCSQALIGLLSGACILLLGRRYLSRLLAKRILRFEEQIPELCRSLSNSLRAGLVLPQAFEVAVRYLPPPASEELNSCLKEYGLGIPMESSLLRLSRQMKSESFTGILSALFIARNAGGDIRRVLDETATNLQTIRRLEQKFQTVTAQAQLQVKVMASLGPVFMGLLLLLTPSNITILFTDPIGNTVLAIIILLELSGFYLARRILIR